MVIKEKKKGITSLVILLFSLHTEASDCISALSEKEQGCSILSILEQQSPSSFQIREEKIEPKKDLSSKGELKITEELTSVEIIHENQKLVIKRIPKDSHDSCPPFCIQPMNIKGVKTVGELEVLDFIKELKGKKANLLIDIRSSKAYKSGTIAGAINIPYNMLDNKSKYQSEVLKLLGGKRVGDRWKFKYIPTLLIFGEDEESSNASDVIKTLLKLSYPSNKIYFYRAGIKGWIRLRLTTY